MRIMNRNRSSVPWKSKEVLIKKIAYGGFHLHSIFVYLQFSRRTGSN